MINAQKFLDLHWPREGFSLGSPTVFRFLDSSAGKERSKIIRLDISSQELEGNLKLEGFASLETLNCEKNQLTSLKIIGSPNLKYLVCSENKITKLDVSFSPNLEKLNCSSNLLTNLDLSQNEKLEVLAISDNNFLAQDLSFLRHLVNLKELFLGNWEINHLGNFNTYNRFTGSLEPLKNLTKLKELEISNTSIDSGLQHLPFSLESLIINNFDDVDNFQPKAKTLATELKKHGEPDNNNFILLFVKWKIARAKELEIKIQELRTAKQKSQYLSIVSFLLLATMSLIWFNKWWVGNLKKEEKISQHKS